MDEASIQTSSVPPPQVEQTGSRDRLGIGLAAAGGVMALLAALLLWQAEGASVFAHAAIAGIANCF